MSQSLPGSKEGPHLAALIPFSEACCLLGSVCGAGLAPVPQVLVCCGLPDTFLFLFTVLNPSQPPHPQSRSVSLSGVSHRIGAPQR